MTQRWHDLLFAHWPVSPQVLRRLVPIELPLDTYDGQCWVAVTPFHMSDVLPRGIPALPGLSKFPELNVRTYVTVENKPGVFFFTTNGVLVETSMNYIYSDSPLPVDAPKLNPNQGQQDISNR